MHAKTGQPGANWVGGEGDTADEESKKVEADAPKVTIKESHGYARWEERDWNDIGSGITILGTGQE